MFGQNTTDYGAVAEVADLLKRLHALPACPQLGLRQLQPSAWAGRRISQATWLDVGDRALPSQRVLPDAQDVTEWFQ